MNNTIATDTFVVVVGLGKTGYSCVRHLIALGHSVAVLDTNKNPGLAEQLSKEFPSVKKQFGSLNLEWLLSANEIVISPGVPLQKPELQQAMEKGIPVIGDIDLFLRKYDGEVIAITGSNGKSTVTTLVGAMAKEQGIKAEIGGNIGIPVLDLLPAKPDMVILELSSFQLETVHDLSDHIAIVLNVSEDHMDRYDSMEHYLHTKHLIFKNARCVVADLGDVLTQPLAGGETNQQLFSLSQYQPRGFYATEALAGNRQIKFGQDLWLNQSDLKLKGNHNLSNALAALSIGLVSGFERSSMIKALKDFPGLDHRCQWVAEINDVDYINDSKATNVGAALAALEGLANSKGKNIVLIAGGVGKGADFSPLVSSVSKNCKSVILMGNAAEEMGKLFQPVVNCFFVESMQVAVQRAYELAEQGDTVLLAPACASFDMFSGFEHRGQIFVESVEALL